MNIHNLRQLFSALTEAMHDRSAGDRLQRWRVAGPLGQRNLRPDLALRIYELTNKPQQENVESGSCSG